MFDKIIGNAFLKAYFQKALEIVPNGHEALFNLGFTYYHMGELEKAHFYFEKIIDMGQKSHRIYQKAIVGLNKIKEKQKNKKAD